MKKLLILCTFILSTVLILTACSSEKIKVYTKTIDNQDIQVTIYHKGDLVNKTITVNKLSNVGNNISSAIDSIKESIKNNNGHPIDNIAGYSYTVEEKDGKINITWETDFTKLDFDKFKSAYKLSENSLDEARELSTVEKRLTDNDFKEKQ